jgi:hypothetical protein
VIHGNYPNGQASRIQICLPIDSVLKNLNLFDFIKSLHEIIRFHFHHQIRWNYFNLSTIHFFALHAITQQFPVSSSLRNFPSRKQFVAAQCRNLNQAVEATGASNVAIFSTHAKLSLEECFSVQTIE